MLTGMANSPPSPSEKPNHGIRRVIYWLATTLLAVFVVGIGQEKWGSDFPNWAYIILCVVTVFLFLYLIVTHPQVKKYHRFIYTYPIMSLVIMVNIGAFVGGGLGWLLWWTTFAENKTAETKKDEAQKPLSKNPNGETHAVNPELQFREPVLIIEPTHGRLKDNEDYKFNLTLRNVGTSDVEGIEVYEYYYRLIDINPLRFEIASSYGDRPNSEIPLLKSKDTATLVVNTKPVVLARRAHNPRPDQKIQMIPIGRIQLRYRRASDGVLFCQQKFFLFWDSESEHILMFESAREQEGLNFPFPSLEEIAQEFGGTNQRRDCQ